MVEVWVGVGFSGWALSDIQDFRDLGLTIVPIRSVEKVVPGIVGPAGPWWLGPWS